MFNKIHRSKWRRSFWGFTLVELIVVITILAILWTIWFISFQGYSGNARDSTRVTDINNISKWLDFKLAQWQILPPPNGNTISITASWVTIWQQGYAGSQVLSAIEMQQERKDPLDKIDYTYLVNTAKNKYQILGLLETSNILSYDHHSSSEISPFIDTAYAASYINRSPFTRGQSLGVLLWTDSNSNQPIQERYDTLTFTGVDIMNTEEKYSAIFSQNDILTGTGLRLVALKPILTQGGNTSTRDRSLVWYWDMESINSHWKLTDLSGNGNEGTCYNSGTSTLCWSNSQWPQLINGNGTTGMAMHFDWIDDFILVKDSDSLDVREITAIAKFKVNYLVTTSVRIFGKWHDKAYQAYINTSPLNTTDLAFVSSFSTNPSDYNLIRSGANFIPYGQYTNLAITQGGTPIAMNLFKNGSKAFSGSASGSIIADQENLVIGNSDFLGGKNRTLFGDIDELRIYNRVLSDAEIQMIYTATK